MSTRISVGIPPDVLEAAGMMQYANRYKLGTREDRNKFKEKVKIEVKKRLTPAEIDGRDRAVPEYKDDEIFPSNPKDNFSWFAVWHNLSGSYNEDFNPQPGGGTVGQSEVSMATSKLISSKALNDDRYFRFVEGLSFLLLTKAAISNQWNDAVSPSYCAYIGEIQPIGPGDQPLFFPSGDVFNEYFNPGFHTENQVQNLSFDGISQINTSTNISIQDERPNRIRLGITTPDLYRRKEVDYKGIGFVPDCLGGSPYGVYLYAIKHLIKASYGSVFLSIRKVQSARYLCLTLRGVAPDAIITDVRDYSIDRTSIPLNVITENEAEFRLAQLVKRMTATGTGYNESQANLPSWMRGNVVEIYKIEPPKNEETNKLILPSVLKVTVDPIAPQSLKNNFPYSPNYPIYGINSTIDMPFDKNTVNAELTIFLSRRNYGAN